MNLSLDYNSVTLYGSFNIVVQPRIYKGQSF